MEGRVPKYRGLEKKLQYLSCQPIMYISEDSVATPGVAFAPPNPD